MRVLRAPSSPLSHFSKTGDVSHSSYQQSLIYRINYARCDYVILWRRSRGYLPPTLAGDVINLTATRHGATKKKK